MSAVAGLRALLVRRIRRPGSIGFEEYLDLVLYHPQWGYYAAANNRVGTGGDFLTSVSHGPALGLAFFLQVREFWAALDCPSPFVVIEQGANDGALTADFLDAARSDPEFLAAVRMEIVEPLPAARQRQRNRLAAFGTKVRWWKNLPARTRPVGAHISNELLDAIPFVPLLWDGNRWFERRVGLDQDGGLAWVLRPVGDCPRLAQAVGKLPHDLPAPWETEIRPRLGVWLARVAGLFQTGLVLACDYGGSRDTLAGRGRGAGTVWCYRGHRRDQDPLADPGHKDISAHVDFSALTEYAAAAGLDLCGWSDQHHFLVGACAAWLRSIDGIQPDRATARRLGSLRFLMHPETLGRRFACIGLGKNLPPGFRPSGFRHARGRSDPLPPRPGANPGENFFKNRPNWACQTFPIG